MKLVIPYQIPFLAKEVGAEITEGVYAATDFWWTLEDKYPLAKMFVDEFHKKYGYRPEWGAEERLHAVRACGRAWSREAGTFYPPDVIKAYEKGETSSSRWSATSISAPPITSWSARSSSSRARAPKDMKNTEDYWEVLEVVPGAGLMQKPDAFGCKLGDYT